MKKIVATFMSIVMMLAILVPSALAQTESQFYDQWYEDTSWKLAKCYYNWNSTGCLGCAGINEEFITAYEYYKSVYPNSKYLAQYTNLYNSTVANKAMYDAMDESQRHIVANGYQAPCSGYFGQMTRCNGDTAFYNFYYACSCMAKPSGDKSVKLKRDGSPAIRARFTPDNVMYLFLKSGYSASVMVKPPSFLL